MWDSLFLLRRTGGGRTKFVANREREKAHVVMIRLKTHPEKVRDGGGGNTAQRPVIHVVLLEAVADVKLQCRIAAVRRSQVQRVELAPILRKRLRQAANHGIGGVV